MCAKWLFAGLLVGGLGWAAAGADEPAAVAKPPEGWVAYTPKDKVFNVWLPKGGKRTERGDWVTVKDIKARVNILELESNDQGTFVVRTILILPLPPAPLNPLPPLGGVGKPGPITPIKPLQPGQLPPPLVVGAPPPPRNPIGPEMSQALTEAARNGFLKEVKGKVADETEVKLGKLVGKEYAITIDAKKSARLRVFALGTFVHYFAVVGTKEQIDGKDADTFLDSYTTTIGEK